MATPDSSEGQVSPSSEGPKDASTNANTRKRKRLNHACNRCRGKKIRCDDRQPICTNCLSAGAECLTTDPRRPTVPAPRHEAQKIPDEIASISAYQQSSSRSVPFPDATRGPPASGFSNGEWGSRTNPATNGSQRLRPDLFAPTSEVDRSRHDQEAREATLRQAISHLPAIPRFSARSSVYILTQWLDLALARNDQPRRFSGLYNESQDVFKNDFRDKHQVSLTSIFSQFVDRQSLMNRFLCTINLVFPVLGPNDSQLNYVGDSWIDVVTADSDSEIKMALQCLLLAVASTGKYENASTLSTECLCYVMGNLGMLLASDSLECVQILLLAAIILRGRNQAAMAWHLHSLAVSMAMTVGLNQNISQSQATLNATSTSQQYYRVWLSLFILDRTLAIELERPVLIRDFDINLNPSDTALATHDLDSISYEDQRRLLAAILSLARLQGQVNERLLISRSRQEAGGLTLSETVAEKMRIIAELDQQLLSWTDELPQDLRPSEHSFCEPEIAPAVSFLATQFYQTLFLLHRNSLILNTKALHATVDTHFGNAPFRMRLKNGQKICTAAARSIVKILNDIDKTEACVVLDCIHAPLVAICVLAIQTLKMPYAEIARADLELQANAIRMISKSSSSGFNSTNLHTSLQALHQAVSSLVNSRSTVAQSGVDMSHPNPASRMIRSQCGNDITSEGTQSSEPASCEPDILSGLDIGLFGEGLDASMIDWDLLALNYNFQPI